VKQEDYAAALALAKEPRARAALAVAAAAQARTPQRALALAREAVKAEPASPVALAALAKAPRGAGKERAARRTLLKGWKRAPHPWLAELWLAPVTDPLARAQAAQKLAAANPGHVESELLLAGTALAARLPGEARRHAEAALRAGNADGRAAAILAELEGKPPPPSAPAWRCEACHTPAAAWHCLCPACGKIGTLRPNNAGLAPAEG
jgi:HemY protein